MALSVQLQSTDPASGETRTITLVKTGADTASAFYESSKDPGNVQKFDLSDVGADAAHGKIQVTYGSFPFGVTATGTIQENPPSVTADAGIFGTFQYPLPSSDAKKIVGFLKDAEFPAIV